MFTITEAAAEAIEFDFPDWRVESEMGDRFLTEFDFEPGESDDLPTVEDWEAFFEMTWVDPAEVA